MNTKTFMLGLFCLLSVPVFAEAQDVWQLNTSVNAMTGKYDGSLIMKKQHGLGVRLNGERANEGGFSVGLQSTHIDMQPLVPKATQEQNNWFLSGYAYTPSPSLSGRFKWQLDVHRVLNDALQGNSDGVSAVVPQVSWVSFDKPLTFDLSYAQSRYHNTRTIHQLSPSLGFGFNNNQNWFQIRGYLIQNLEPNLSMGMSSSHATDFRLTQLFQSPSPWVPQSVTLGLERGKKIYFVDAVTQTVHNLPMRNDGGENIAAVWRFAQSNQLKLQLQQTHYFSNDYTAHDFSLKTLSAQISRDW
jgi:hypothetical protein